MQRLYVECDLGEGGTVSVGARQAHYLANVLRLKPGAEVLLFNGRDGEWRAAITGVGKKEVTLTVAAMTRPQTLPSDLVYCFAPLKQGRLDYMVQKAVEMGAGVLQPVVTQHTQVGKVGVARLQANVMEAAEQCGILALPRVHEAVRLDRLLAQWEAGRRLVFCDEDAQGDNPIDALRAIGGNKLGLLIGPEGGFSDEERRQLRALDFVTPIPLGPRILRADTAAVAALAVLQATIGDWQITIG